jgi:hypothetical protein
VFFPLIEENESIMMATPARSGLAETVLSFVLAEELIRERVAQINRDVLARSPYIREPNFTIIHARDLEFLFVAYDERFLVSLCQKALGERRLRFRLAPRMTRAGGKTTRFTPPCGEVSYEIAIAVSMLFDAFRTTDRRMTVCGLECQNRLEALQRIFEHELVHLIEQLCWQNSDCSAGRFQGIAKRLFLHQTHTHELITRKERAASSGIRIGSHVAFEFEGRRLTGRVNRITKRATVLVEDAEGHLFSDGLRYKTYYVPIAWLIPATSS